MRGALNAFETVEARYEGRTRDAVRLRAGGRAHWLPVATLAAESLRAIEAADIGETVKPRIMAWKLRELNWPPARDPATADLFGRDKR